MTKNLFLLFVLYFFVVQALFLGVLTGDSLYYKLGGINAIAIFLIVVLYHVFTAEKSDVSKAKKADHLNTSPINDQTLAHKDEHKTEHMEKETIVDPKPVKEPLNETGGIQKIVQVAPIQKKRRKKAASGQWWILLITLLIALALHGIGSEFLTYRSPLMMLLIGCIAFFIIGKLFDVKGFSKARTLFTTRIYISLLFLATTYAGLYMTGRGELVEKYLPALRQISFSFLPNEDPNADQSGLSFGSGDYIYEGTGQLITSSQGDLPLQESTGVNIPTGTVVSTGMLTTSTTGAVLPTKTEVTNITMMEALKHVIDATSIPLSTKMDVDFTSIRKDNADYAYFKTAYEKRMIGKTTDPSKQISCETYMVIKGLGENWQVGSYTDIKAAYRKKAEALNKLNGCTKGGRVTSATL